MLAFIQGHRGIGKQKLLYQSSHIFSVNLGGNRYAVLRLVGLRNPMLIVSRSINFQGREPCLNLLAKSNFRSCLGISSLISFSLAVMNETTYHFSLIPVEYFDLHLRSKAYEKGNLHLFPHQFCNRFGENFVCCYGILVCKKCMSVLFYVVYLYSKERSVIPLYHSR